MQKFPFQRCSLYSVFAFYARRHREFPVCLNVKNQPFIADLDVDEHDGDYAGELHIENCLYR